MNLLNLMHSSLRWAVLLAAIYALYRAASGLSKKSAFGEADQKAGLFLTISCDLQLLLGLALYFFGAMGYKNIQANGMGFVMKDPLARFFAVEHLSMMLLAIILIHIGKAKTKKSVDDAARHRSALIFYGLGLLLILAAIPWPFLSKFSHLNWL